LQQNHLQPTRQCTGDLLPLVETAELHPLENQQNLALLVNYRLAPDNRMCFKYTDSEQLLYLPNWTFKLNNRVRTRAIQKQESRLMKPTLQIEKGKGKKEQEMCF